MKKLYLARHGQTELNLAGRVQGWSDSPLTDQGKKQALQLKELLDGLGADIDVSVSSDLQRAVETMQIVSASDLMFATPALREISFGDLDGSDGSLIDRDTWNEDAAKYHGESVDDCVIRVYRSLREIVSDPRFNEILVISHGLPLSMMYTLLDKDPEKEWNEEEIFTNGTMLEYEIDEKGHFLLKNLHRVQE